MKLKEIINELIEKKYGNPREMAFDLRETEMDIRRLAGLAGGSQRNQEKIFQFTLKILPVCHELGIDPAQNLNPPTELEIIAEVDSNDKTARGAQTRGKTVTKKAGVSVVSTRRIAGASGKNR